MQILINNYTIFPTFSDFSTKSCDSAPKYPRNAPKDKSANKAHFVVYFFNLSKYYTLEISVLGKQGLLVIQNLKD
jgi:hypothetical protein